MGRHRLWHFTKTSWRFTKWIVGWPLAIIGIVGLPDTINLWEKFIDKTETWIGEIMTDPHVKELAEKFVKIADIVNLFPVRVALVITGVAILIWAWPFWKLRHRVLFLMRSILGEQTWISRADALKIIRSSEWAQLRAPGKTLGEILTRSLFLSPESLALDATQTKFNVFLGMTLDSFENNNPNYVKITNDKKEYLEDKLLLFLKRSIEEEALKQFGPLPHSSV
jgi:hypothetical protein